MLRSSYYYNEYYDDSSSHRVSADSGKRQPRQRDDDETIRLATVTPLILCSSDTINRAVRIAEWPVVVGPAIAHRQTGSHTGFRLWPQARRRPPRSATAARARAAPVRARRAQKSSPRERISLHVGRSSSVCSYCATYEPLMSQSGGYGCTMPTSHRLRSARRYLSSPSRSSQRRQKASVSKFLLMVFSSCLACVRRAPGGGA